MQLAEIQTNKQISMTSLQIAELCDKRHDSVKRTIEILSKPTDKRPAVISKPHSVDGEKSANGITPKLFVFTGEQGRLDSITIVAQLCPQFTAALVARWDELEKQAAKPQIALPQDYLSALKALVESEESKQALLVEYNEVKPKADALDLLTGSKYNLSIRDTASELKVKEKDLKAWLIEHKWAYYKTLSDGRKGSLMPAVYAKDMGYISLDEVPTYNTGETIYRSQTRITPKGLERLAKVFSKVA